MATLNSLKKVLVEVVNQKPASESSPSRYTLTDESYNAALEALLKSPGWETYDRFIIPQLSQLLDRLCEDRPHISVLEVGPGSKSVLGYLPERLRRKIRRYVAFEPNLLSATRLNLWLSNESNQILPLPCLNGKPEIHRGTFAPNTTEIESTQKFDFVLFCHSMYGMKPKRIYVERALELLKDKAGTGLTAIFHRDGVLDFDGLVSHQTASFPTGQIRIADNDDELDRFASFITGFTVGDANIEAGLCAQRREICRTLGRRDESASEHLYFRSPETMVVFNRHAPSLPEITDQVPRLEGIALVKSWEARAHYPSAIVRPTNVHQVEQCVQWALKHELSLTVIGGGHSGHCIRSHVVSVDMSAFNKLEIIKVDDKVAAKSSTGPLIFIEAGCRTGDIIRETMNVGLTLPLGDRPSVGIGIILQGGIGHLSKLYGLAVDTIVGAVLVSVDSGRACFVGDVPAQHRLDGAKRSINEDDLLWALKGAGTNFGIVVGLTCRTFPAQDFLVQHRIFQSQDDGKVSGKLKEDYHGIMTEVLKTSESPKSSTDFYFFKDTDHATSGRVASNLVKMGLTTFDVSTNDTDPLVPKLRPSKFLDPSREAKLMNGVEMFDSGMYMSTMHGGHAGGKTSSFKRCVLFQLTLAREQIVGHLVAAVQASPSPLCYIHLLEIGEEMARQIVSHETAFAARFCDFACVITGVWPRDQDGSEIVESTTEWVYKTVHDLLSLDTDNRVYSADLGPDPRDAALVAQAFGDNLPCLARLKNKLDPKNILAYACPLPKPTVSARWIFLVTGSSCSGKDFCAKVWAEYLDSCVNEQKWPYVDKKALRIGVRSISDVTKREFAEAAGLDFDLLLHDRAYKEEHRSSMTAFFEEQVRKRPNLPKEHFQSVVFGAADIDILFVTGMRELAPVAMISHLVPESKVIDIHVYAPENTRLLNGATRIGESGHGGSPSPATLGYAPDLVFTNDARGPQPAKMFANDCLQPFFHKGLTVLRKMVGVVMGFPREGFNFHHILGIAQNPRGLTLSASAFKDRLAGGWGNVNAIASVETGGYIFAAALAQQVGRRMILIREAGKLPPPTISVAKSPSYVTSASSNNPTEQRIEMEDTKRYMQKCTADDFSYMGSKEEAGSDYLEMMEEEDEEATLGMRSSIVVIDDVLSTGATLCAVLQLLTKAGVLLEDITVMVLAEFPLHRGRQLLCERGFAKVNVQSLLVFGGR